LVQDVFGGLARWDSRHFLHIAEYGYTWESELAFFPLFPTVLRISGTFFQYVISSLTLSSAMILGGVLINNVSLYRFQAYGGGSLQVFWGGTPKFF
jgi:GPI mannosyltransferase 2